MSDWNEEGLRALLAAIRARALETDAFAEAAGLRGYVLGITAGLGQADQRDLQKST